MNIKNHYLVNELFNYTNQLRSSLKMQAPQEYVDFLPIGILLMKWINDSKDRFLWKVSENLNKLITSETYPHVITNINESLYNAAVKIEKDNPILHGIFTSLCFSYIDHIDPKYLKDIIASYRNFKFHEKNIEKDITGPFMELLLEELSADSSFYSFITPKSIKELLSRLFNINENMYIADITSGTCGILSEVVNEYSRYSLDINDEINLYAQEINFKIALMGKVNLLLHGITKFNIVTKDSLKESILDRKDNSEKFDIILSNLPLGTYWNSSEINHNRDFKYGFPNKMYADWLFIQRGIASLNELFGKAAFIVSKGTLTRVGEKNIRKSILKDNLIEAVISLPSNLYGSKTMPIEILVINRSKETWKNDKILFIDASKEHYKKDRGKNDLNKNHITKILSAYHNWKEIDGYSKIIDHSTIEKYNFELDSSLYVNNKEMLLNQSKMKKLNEIAEVKRGLQILKNDMDKSIDTLLNSYFYIKIGDINDGKISFNEKIRGLPDSKIASYELKPGDIIISARGNLIKTAIYEENMPPSILSGNILLIRIKSNYNPYFLKFYLDSSKGKELIQNMQGGATITALNHSKLQELLIPDISLDKQNRLSERIQANETNYTSIIQHATSMYEQNKEIINKEIIYLISD